MIVIAEDIWDQTVKHNVCKDSYFKRERAKAALRSFTYSYIDIDNRQYVTDSKRLKIIRNVRKHCDGYFETV